MKSVIVGLALVLTKLAPSLSEADLADAREELIEVLRVYREESIARRSKPFGVLLKLVRRDEKEP